MLKHKKVINKDKIVNYFLKLNSNKLLFYIIIFCLFISWFILTHLTKLKYDDFNYQYIFNSEIRVKTLKDIFQSQYDHYLRWGGRTVAHSLDQLFLMTDKIIFDIFNAIVFCTLVITIYSFKLKKNINNVLLVFIAMGLWFCAGDVDRGLIWQTGSFNYLWMIWLSALFVKPYIDFYFKKKKKYFNNKFSLIIYFLFSFIAGWGHEIISPTILFALIVYFLYKYKNKLKIDKFEIIGFTGYLIGSMFLIFAPGNFYRFKIISGFGEGGNYYILKIIFSFLRNTYYLITYTTPLLISSAIILAYRKQVSKNINLIYYFILIFIFSVTSSSLFLGYANSCLILPVCIMLTIISISFDYLNLQKHGIYVLILFIFIFTLFIAQYGATVYLILKYGKEVNHVFNLVS